ncbi:penicillin acylase family protein [Actinomycetes bacterium KLBMP 9759]
MLKQTAALGLALAVAATAACGTAVPSTPAPAAVRQAPHIVAPNHLELGRGIGYAQAHDRLCELVGIFAAARGQSGDVASDVQFRDVRERGVVEGILAQRAPKGPTQEVRDLIAGYADGYNRLVREAPACGATPIEEIDVYRFDYVVGMEGYNRGLKGIVDAEPPGSEKTPVTVAPPRRTGSNAIAVGSAGSKSGKGVLLGNPHVPWSGIASFWHSRLTIPGVLDVEGTQILGMPVLFNGYNRDVAWSATISTGVSYALVELQLVPGDPTSYVVDGQPRKMRRTAEGLWHTDFGPVLEQLRTNAWLSGDEVTKLPWTERTAYALHDAAADRLTALNAVSRFPQARSTGDLQVALEEGGGTARTNIVAADRSGDAMFAGVQVIPAVDTETCSTALGTQLYPRTGVPVLDGTRSACAPRDTVPMTDMPVLHSAEYATNSNASHTFAHAGGQLSGFPRLFGDETTPNLRTEHGLAEIQKRMGRFDADEMQQLVLENRNTAAEKHLDTTLAQCASWTDLRAACDVLAAWDRRNEVDSRGAQLFDTFWAKGGTRTALAAAWLALGETADDPLGDHQFIERDGKRIPMHGGPSSSGVYNLINMADGDVADGSTFLMAVEFTDAECPVARTLMAPRDPQLFSAKQWQPGLLCQ